MLLLLYMDISLQLGKAWPLFATWAPVSPCPGVRPRLQ